MNSFRINNKLQDDALLISKEARIAKNLDNSVVDATLGTFYFEDGSFHTFDVIRNELKSLSDEELFLYSPSNGGDTFKESAYEFVFSKYKDQFPSFSKECMATPGGTGAISASIEVACDYGESVLIPYPCWGPYFGICKERGLNTITFDLFDGYNFSLDDFKKKALILQEKQNKVVFILNDPCNNPTGYTLSNEELQDLIDFLNTLSCSVVLIYDCAYIDMVMNHTDSSREKLTLFKNLNDNIILNICFSFSKTCLIFGERLGGLIILSKNSDIVHKFYDASCFYARNTWSNCNKGMISLINNIYHDDVKIQKLKDELYNVQELLSKRSNIFIDEAGDCGLKHYPYMGGFFIAIPVKDNKTIFRKLIEEEKIYSLPVCNSIRIAICSLNCMQIHGLPRKIKKIIDKYDK